MEERYKVKVFVDLLLEKNGKVLLGLRKNRKSYSNMWDLPGGHLEKDEDIFEAMIREVKEEIGIDIKRKDLEIVHIRHSIKKDALNFVFIANNYENEIVNNEPDLCEELKWFDIDNLPENIIPKIEKKISEIKNNIKYSYDK